VSAIIEFRNVRFAHPERTIFDDLSFAVEEREMIALVGPNGVGKTTLLKIVAGLLRPTSGAVLLQGRGLESWSRRELSCYAALVPQHLDVPFAFRVDELVAQGRVPHLRRFAGPSARDLEVVESAMQAVDIVGMRERAYSDLSGGERQRVKIAIGLAQQPKVMMLDEPTQHLDLGRQIELMGLLRTLNAHGITILAAMHDLALVRENFSSVILLMPEAVSIAGPTAEVLRPELLERAFLVDRSSLSRHESAGSLTYERGDQY
jgi:iron complex transport system ATP-binding protein